MDGEPTGLPVTERPAEWDEEHAHYFVYAGKAADEEGVEHEIERCASPGCGEERRRGEG